MSTLTLEEQSAPSTPGANKVVVYPKSDGLVYSKDDAGVEILLGFTAATQAQQESGTSTAVVVTPGRQQYHPSAAKVWCQANFAGASVVGYNISSITDTGTGQVTFNFTTAFSTANWACVAQIMITSAALICRVNSLTASTALIESYNAAGVLTDGTSMHMVGYGDQ